MTESITALYENGVLRPLKPLQLREKQRVQLYVTATETETEEADEAREGLIRWLGANDLLWILEEDEDDERWFTAKR